nr:cytochrome p450 [Quercus suber]
MLKFNLERFVQGIVGACKTQQAYMPIGEGSRVCTGQYFAMTKPKVFYLHSIQVLPLTLASILPIPAFWLVIPDSEHEVTVLRTALHFPALRKALVEIRGGRISEVK